MTHTDNELFELCKSVYEKTGFKNTDFHYRFGITENTIIKSSTNYNYVLVAGLSYSDLDIPLYTSDYLLEKLQRPHTSVVFEYFESFITVIRYNAVSYTHLTLPTN